MFLEERGVAMMAFHSSMRVMAMYLWTSVDGQGRAPVRSVNQRLLCGFVMEMVRLMW